MKAVDIAEITLQPGSHNTREDGLCVMEAVAWLAGEKHSDMPKCASPVISQYCQVLNDAGPEFRERLKPYIYKIIGTVSPELDQARGFIAADYAVRVFAPIALRHAGLTQEANSLELLSRIVDRETAAYAYAYSAAYDAAYAATAAGAVDEAFRCLDAMLWPAPLEK
jgi:hypothetical protein